MMRKLFVLFVIYINLSNSLAAQCDLAVNEVDPFDSTHLVVAKPIPVGYQIPSQYTMPDGNFKMIEEGKILFTYTENDTINSFFMTLALAEHSFFSIEPGFKVWLLLSNERVVGLYDVPDKGEFDKNTNMRIFQHTCVVPIDMYYVLTYLKVEKIRIEYKGYKKTLEILPQQQDALKEAIRCVGEAVGLYPVKP
ncbi:MAG: hypothetical protein SFU99_15850 [Saprospiraceae bacterium]|nr:hypothetical protein [Saprospiraceae bacterium]